MSANSDRKARKQAETRANLAQIASRKAGETVKSPGELKSPLKPQQSPGNPIAERNPRERKAGKPGKPKTLAKGLVCSASPRMRARIWKPIVLDTLRKIPNITIAAEAAGISRNTLLEHKARDPKFAEAVRAACDQGIEVLEAACWQRATTGWTDPIFQRDKEGNPIKVGERRMFSDRLAETLLRAHAPEKYSPKIQQDITSGGQALPSVIAPTVIFNIPDNGRGLPEPKPIEITNGEAEPGSGAPEPEKS